MTETEIVRERVIDAVLSLVASQVNIEIRESRAPNPNWLDLPLEELRKWR